MYGDSYFAASYTPGNEPKKKNFILVGKMYHRKKRGSIVGQEGFFDIITFYKSTVGEVDVDMMMDKYNVSRSCQRWGLTLFLALLNSSRVVSYVLFLCCLLNNLNTLLRHSLLENNWVPKKLRKGIASVLIESAVMTE